MGDRPKEVRLRPRYWDACLFIDIIQRDKPERLLVLDGLVKIAKSGKLLVVTSALTIGEVLYGPEGTQSNSLPEEDIRFVETFFDQPWISVRAADRRIYREAAILRRKYNLELPDAVHVATALAHKEVTILETYDEKHLLKLGRKDDPPPIPIKIPKCPDPPMPLFDHQESSDDTEQ